MSLAKSGVKSKLEQYVRSSADIVITCHFSPDDDAIASLLATYLWITTNFPKKQVNMIVTGSYLDRFESFLNYQKIKFVDDLSYNLHNGIDLLIMLDGSQYSRFSHQPISIANHLCKKICFDHHSSPVDTFDLICLDKTATSASEIVLDTLYKNETVSPELAEIVLMGILGDTGTFNYLKPNQLHTLDNVKKLLQISGVEIQDFKAKYSRINQSVFQIIQEYIRNTKFVTLKNNHNYQYSYIKQTIIDKNHYSESDVSEAGHIYMANYLRLIKDYSWGFIATPKRKEISVSFRSLPRSVNVRAIVEKLEIGGGHDRAAGSSFKADKWGKKLSLNFVIKYLVDWIASHKLELS